MRLFYLILGLIIIYPAYANKKKVDIIENTTPFSIPFIENFAKVSVALGVKEPLTVRYHDLIIAISGQNSVVCRITVLQDSEKVSGINCQ